VPVLSLTHEHRLGRTSVNVVQDITDESAALVFCAKEVRRLKVLADFSPLEFSTSPVWLTSRENVRGFTLPVLVMMR
jgi:hypothetical protein